LELVLKNCGVDDTSAQFLLRQAQSYANGEAGTVKPRDGPPDVLRVGTSLPTPSFDLLAMPETVSLPTPACHCIIIIITIIIVTIIISIITTIIIVIVIVVMMIIIIIIVIIISIIITIIIVIVIVVIMIIIIIISIIIIIIITIILF
jgi:hypothetical protein